MTDYSENPIDMLDSSGDLSLSSASISYLTEVGRWSKFLSILGFIGISILILFGFFAGTIFQELSSLSNQPNYMSVPSFAFGFIYIILALIYLPPLIYLYTFSAKIKMALVDKNNTYLENAFKNLKSHYKYIGIFTIVTMSLYFLLFIAALFMGAIM